MAAYTKIRNGLVKTLEWAIIVMVIVLTIDVLWGVFTRFVLGSGLAHSLLKGIIPEEHLGQAKFTDELACVMLVWISMFGGALAFGRKAHLGVDVFLSKFHPEARKILFVVVQLIILAMTIGVFWVGGWKLATGQLSQELPTMRWMSRGEVYFSLPVAGFFILLFTLEHLVTVLRTPADKLGGMTQSEG
ncbi:MAG: TRAP transporter small permease [Kiritimatiellae bacterium]|nr:TRAP transporter small permease [Kiritimatiellia bacterium]